MFLRQWCLGDDFGDMNRIVRRRGVDRPMGEIKATSVRYGNIGKIIVHKKHRFPNVPNN